MTYEVWPEAKWARAALIPAMLAMTLLPAAGEERVAASKLPANVDAVYGISFTALGNIGHFHFNSTIAGESYKLVADAKIDTTFFDYRGNMSAKGAVQPTGIAARPQDYVYTYKQKTFPTKKKVKTLNIAFAGDSVDKVLPEEPPSPKVVPVTPAQLKNVVDPLSGVMTLSLTSLAAPCDQRLPIFDGKQRYDIVFTPLRRAGSDHVCKVRLIPISGHKPGGGAASVVKGDIELVMRPVPNANVVIPYSVVVPTIIGTVTLTSEKVDITMPDQQRIALRR
jgi:uncharacterized protein DUF3108